MGNTYTQIHIHSVMAVKHRAALINHTWNNRLHAYMTAILQRNGHKMLCINSMPDHLHMLFGFRPNQSLSDLMRILKGETSEWINQQGFCKHQFRWQEGYGAFSFKRSDLPMVANYIETQEEHHKKKTFLEEYKNMLEEFEVDFDDKYLFKEPE